MRVTTLKAAVASAFVLSGTGAFADSISPTSFSATLAIGESVTIHKTVIVSAGRPTSAKVDVFFLSDTTGSMSGQIGAAKSSAGAIMSDLAGLGDLHFGAGDYKDIFDSYAYRTDADLTGTTSDVQAGINTWFAGGGGDFPESGMLALEKVASTTAWRDGSRRFIVNFGDAPGHVGDAYGASEAGTIAALNAVGATVLIGNTDGTSLSGMNSAVDTEPAGQANRIAAATGGSVFTLDSSGTDIKDKILAAIDAEFASYSTVSLAPIGNLPGVSVTTSPAYTGTYTRDIDRTFEFDVTFTALTAGVHTFSVDALVDGGSIASEADKIDVGGMGAVPLPAGLPLLLSAFAAGGLVLRRRNRA